MKKIIIKTILSLATLISLGASITSFSMDIPLDEMARSLLIYRAVDTENIYLLKRIVEDKKFDIKKPFLCGDFKGETPIFRACALGKTKVVKFLIDYTNFKDALKDGPFEGSTPFIIACNTGGIDIVKLLIKEGVNFNEANKFGHYKDLRPIDIACIHNLEISKLLLQNNATIDKKLANNTKISPETQKYIKLTQELNEIKNKNGDVLKFVSSKQQYAEEFKFLTKLTFCVSVNEFRKGKSIELTPFYIFYIKIKKLNKLKKSNFLRKLFGTPEIFDQSKDNIFQFIKTAMNEDCFGTLSNKLLALIEKRTITPIMLNTKEKKKFCDCKIKLLD